MRRGPGGRRVYSEDDVDWLTICIILRASGIPLPALRRYADLVREGADNEEERLALMREHHARVAAEIGRLTQSLDLIGHKVAVYEDLVDQGTATAHPCQAPSQVTDEQRTPPLPQRSSHR
ncbi:MerR family transcriptional regulator [Streptomyces sp. NPDC021749]|uniref:MerR family transcriptional regulator n=1 Tax=Streptomyces sp. NPDC021749 TaxID=3154905 RepID=UPI0033EE8FD7